METPDKWIVVKIGSGENPLYKVFASWYGGYLGSDSWKMNSGIVKVEDDGHYFKFWGYSGSCYQCLKGTYGTNAFAQGVLNSILDLSKQIDNPIEVMSEDTDWLKLLE